MLLGLRAASFFSLERLRWSIDGEPRCAGGSLYFYPGFTAQRDGRKLRAEVTHNLLRTTGWEAVMRLRCSKGMRIASFHGHLFVRSNDLVALPCVSADDTIVAQMQARPAICSMCHPKISPNNS